MPPIAVITRALPDAWTTTLAGACELKIGPAEWAGIAPGLEPHLATAEGLLCMLTETVNVALLDRMPRLRVVSNMAVGYDNVDVAACTARGIPVGNTPGVLTEATADLTLALLLSAARRLPESSAAAKAGNWTIWSPTAWLGADLHGATLGIVGLGKIGAAVAQRAQGFGMQIVYTNRRPRPEHERLLRVRRVTLDELLAISDFVTLHVPLTGETRGLIGEPQLRAMGPTAILVNTARGPVIDTDALARALGEGWIAAAALDVTDPEPLPPDHPLYGLANCLVAPHIGSATRGTRKRMALLACDNLLAGLRNEPLPHCVNGEVYGR